MKLFFTFFLALTLWVNAASQDGLSIGWFTYLSNKQEINPDYEERPDASFTSAARMSYALKVEYNGLFGEHFETSFGMLAGAYPTDFIVAFDSVFSIYGHSFDEYYFNRHSAVYLGFYGAAGYVQKLSEHHFIAARLGVNIVYFIPSFYGYSASTIRDTGRYKFFDASANMNPNGKLFLAPEVSFRYYYKLLKHYMPYISFNGVYSNSYPVIGNRYSIYGKSETLNGTFKRRFLHAGIELGVKVDL